MSEIKFIKAALNVVVSNHQSQRDDPPYVCFDENWVEVERCHNFFGQDCELIFEEEFESTYANRGRPKGVYVELKGAFTLDPVVENSTDPLYMLVESHKGMDTTPRQPIWCNDISAYTRVKIIGAYTGRYEPGAIDPLWVECDELEGSHA